MITQKSKFIATVVFIIMSLTVLFIWQEIRFSDGKLHVVFCDVGQGDGIFIRTPNKIDILIDGGPDKKILDCLSSHMPFWDRKIELLILTHPHQDHFAGFFDVLGAYDIGSFLTEKLENKSQGFQEFLKAVTVKGLKIQYVYAGARIKTTDGLRFQIVGPSKRFLAKTSPEGVIGENKEFASLETLISFGQTSILLTGDSQADELMEAIQSNGLDHIDILQVPHHGSKTGLTRKILDELTPIVAVISVGKKNRYGHPSDEVIKLLSNEGIKILRTDQNGEVEIVSDGRSWSVKTTTNN